ncbi:efflux RND transporter permease subunit [Polynucleobacter sp. MWH-UH25E]|uniref:efflux RND transporter permease subunit n=1 Tax=Polynucleobacter sp. MWH-UH25E TaxID=1855616 RepID=UPI001BFE917E|nr:efflux RND transporter permease subunit [Polynucleobacter sp. MWH-UH25E]QWD62167.1 efflux RND transporter permease subunit [Polynucleobacter sp. MWH-UH25E]
MIRLVKLALEKPYTFVVMAILIALMGIFSALRSPIDIFPEIRIPVISVVWSYTGMQPEDMAGRVIYSYERALSSTVNDIEHIESQSLPGYGIVKIFFQPSVDIRLATAQVTSISQTVLKQMPPGITPPLILNYNAATVPIVQLALSSLSLSEQRIFDFGQNFIRPALASVPGSAVPSPYGGKTRQIQIDLRLAALQARKLTPNDVISALAAQNLIIPTGTQKIGEYEYSIKLNNGVNEFKEIADFPIKLASGAVIQLRDVAQVRDGSPPQTNLVRLDGGKAVLMTILKSGAVSTLDIIDGVKALVPKLKESLPPELNININGDQSVFVKASISGVIHEGLIAAALTSLMILLFLGSWRSTVIIASSIPLAILFAVIMLNITGETLNIMTLGGLALAVGILVDDATVTIENINWHLEQGKPIQEAILDGAAQIVGPAFVALLCICIVFVPMFFLEGVSKFLFVPMAKAVMFAMIGSFILSRTFVPTFANFILKEIHGHDEHASGHLRWAMDINHTNPAVRIKGRLAKFQYQFENVFNSIRKSYFEFLKSVITNQKKFIVIFMVGVLGSYLLIFSFGREFFPAVDGGQIKMHVRVPVGTRLEETARQFNEIEAEIRRLLPNDQIESIVDNIGLSVSGINMAYSNTGTIGPQDGDILVSLVKGHSPTDEFVKQLREELPKKFPSTSFSFLPADIVSQILNFGAPAPIDIIVKGTKRDENFVFTAKLLERVKNIPGIVDVRIQQATNYPQINVDVDRVQAAKIGITQRDITNNMVTTLAGSGQVAPAFWLNPSNGISYPVVVQTPQIQVSSISDLLNIPVAGANASTGTILGGISSLRRNFADAVVTHDSIKPSFDIYADTQGRDLGAVASDINRIIEEETKNIPKGTTVELRGQVSTMNSAFTGLGLGLIGSIVLIYLILVVNFQSWLDPFVIITALPAAIAGIIWILFLTFTNLSVPALTGVIMCMGVATANSILVVSFARERLPIDRDPIKAALEAGFSRFRPVMMTALAMVIGMAPMALGLGEGGEQNAPLGRAVVGGLIFATFATLIFVPVVFSLVHRNYGSEKA